MPLLPSRLSERALATKLDAQKCKNYIASLPIRACQSLNLVQENNIKVSTVHLRLNDYKDVRVFIEDCRHLIDLAAAAGAQLILFPHLTGLLPVLADRASENMAHRLLEALSSQAPGRMGDTSLRQRFTQLMDHISDAALACYTAIFSTLSHRYGIYIAPGSTYVAMQRGIFCRSFLFSPFHDEPFSQDKLTLSPTERRLGVLAGSELRSVDTEIGRLVLLTDTDSALYECYKVALALGAQIVLSPALLSEPYGYNLHYNPSMMAAQHYSLYTVRSSLYSMGNLFAPFKGASGIYAPMEMTKNSDGIIIHTSANDEAGGVLSSRIEPPKLKSEQDAVYTSFRNPPFYGDLMSRVYQEYFLAKSSLSPQPQRTAAQRITLDLGAIPTR